MRATPHTHLAFDVGGDAFTLYNLTRDLEVTVRCRFKQPLGVLASCHASCRSRRRLLCCLFRRCCRFALLFIVLEELGGDALQRGDTWQSLLGLWRVILSSWTRGCVLAAGTVPLGAAPTALVPDTGGYRAAVTLLRGGMGT